MAHAVRSGRLRRLHRNVYTAGPVDDPCLQALGAARAYQAAVISHRSAAALHGLPLLGRPAPRPELTVPPASGANLPRCHVHRARLRRHDAVLLGDARVTSVPRTLVDLARTLDRTDAVVVLDAALNGRRLAHEEIEDVVRFCWNWPGIRRARAAVALADARAESPLESVSRLVLRDLRLPEPDLQTVILDQFSRPRARADFYWDEFGVVGEADGRSKYSDRDVLVREKQRQETLEELGLVVVRWDWTSVTKRPNELAGRITQAFDRGRRRDRSGFPRLWSL